MTKDQAIEVLRCNTNLGYGIVIENESTQLIKEAIEMAIKSLEQQPSEDCVSRAKALSAIRNLYPSAPFVRMNLDKWQEKNKKYFECEDIIKALPPVTPTRKQGKWDKGYGFPDGAYWKCSCCNELIKVRYPMNFCPNCGASFKEEKRGNENG